MSASLGDGAPPWTAGPAIPTGDFPKIQNLASSDFQAPLDGCMSASMNSLTAQGWDTGQGLSAVAMPRPALDPDEDRMIPAKLMDTRTSTSGISFFNPEDTAPQGGREAEGPMAIDLPESHLTLRASDIPPDQLPRPEVSCTLFLPPSGKGNRWQLDVVGPLQLGPGGERCIAVAVDSFTKWPEAEALKSKSSLEMEGFFYNKVIRKHPVIEVLTDDGLEFKADFGKLCKEISIKQVKTSMNPLLLEEMERFIGRFTTALSRLAGGRPASWPDFIPVVLGTVLGTPDATTGFSPARLMRTTMGSDMPEVTPATVSLADNSLESAMSLDDNGLEGPPRDPTQPG